MTLVTRVSLFFLVALAILMGSYTLALNLIARHYMHHEFDDELRSAMTTLQASVEVEDDGVEWNPLERVIEIGTEMEQPTIEWAVFDEQRKLIDFSGNQTAQTALRWAPTPESEAELADGINDGRNGHWRYFQRHLLAPKPEPGPERDPNEYDALTIVVAGSTLPVEAQLSQLAWLSIALTALAWLLAAALGRWYCGQALAPVRRMADSARAISPDDSTKRIAVATSRDELADLGRAFNGLLDDLFAANEQQRRFAGDAAHQLRTPLTVLQGHVDVSLRRPRSAAEYEETLRTLQSQVIDLKQLIEAMLLLARSKHEIAASEMESLDLAHWLPQHLARWELRPRGGDVQVHIESSVVCRVPRALLGQLVDNLIDNALKYSPTDTPVSVSLSREARHAVLRVKDQGHGISPEQQALIFEPFFRSDDARRHGTPGAGLGLAIARRIAELLGGTLTCESKLGEGSCFTLRIPGLESSSPARSSDAALAR